MATVTHLDTHVVVWLFGGLIEKIPASARELLEASTLRVSPVVALELQYLHEIKRLKPSASALMGDLQARIGLELSDAAYVSVVTAALELKWTRDPFDRLIVANALVEGALLLTADDIIHKHSKNARWA